MRIKLSLSVLPGSGVIIPVNYQYPLSAAIYKVIESGDAAYSYFLHEQGYRQENSLKSFKLFTFSDLKVSFQIQGDRLIMRDNQAQLIVCFHISEAATRFVKGLFMQRQIDIADQKNKASFIVQHVEVMPLWDQNVSPDEVKEVVLRPISPMCVGITDDKGRYIFIYPDDERFVPAFMHHWREKYKVVYGDEAAVGDFKEVELSVFNADQAKSRLITIKAGTPAATSVRGFVGFGLRVKAKVKVLELALNAGVGVYGSMGFGCVEVTGRND